MYMPTPIARKSTMHEHACKCIMYLYMYVPAPRHVCTMDMPTCTTRKLHVKAIDSAVQVQFYYTISVKK